jgi:hypothetical protein
MDGCLHSITKGKEGQKGSWCIECGAHVLAVHDKPCGQCFNFLKVSGGTICRKHMMAVSADMRVTYYVNPNADLGRSGLCFVAAD